MFLIFALLSNWDWPVQGRCEDILVPVEVSKNGLRPATAHKRNSAKAKLLTRTRITLVTIGRDRLEREIVRESVTKLWKGL